jgi:hypothetical protein
MLCLGCVSKVNSENDEYQSCLPCVSKLCGCPKRVDLRSKNSGKSGAINFSVSNEIKVEVSTQNEKQDAKGSGSSGESEDCIPHSVNLENVRTAPQ